MRNEENKIVRLEYCLCRPHHSWMEKIAWSPMASHCTCCCISYSGVAMRKGQVCFVCCTSTWHTVQLSCRWASTSVLMSAISDIDICYSDIGRKYVGLKTVIPISEGFRYRYLSPFRYPISQKYLSYPQASNPRHLLSQASAFISQPLCWSMK